jgi:signal transduction histidine kinase
MYAWADLGINFTRGELPIFTLGIAMVLTGLHASVRFSTITQLVQGTALVVMRVVQAYAGCDHAAGFDHVAIISNFLFLAFVCILVAMLRGHHELQASNAKQLFTSKMSHELRTSLSQRHTAP